MSEKQTRNVNHIEESTIAFAGQLQNEGISALECQDYEMAIEKFTEAININPENLSYYYERGIAKTYLSRFESAIIDFDMVIQLDSNHASAYFYRAIAKCQLKEFSGAISDIDQALLLKPQDQISQTIRYLLTLVLQK